MSLASIYWSLVQNLDSGPWAGPWTWPWTGPCRGLDHGLDHVTLLWQCHGYSPTLAWLITGCCVGAVAFSEHSQPAADLGSVAFRLVLHEWRKGYLLPAGLHMWLHHLYNKYKYTVLDSLPRTYIAEGKQSSWLYRVYIYGPTAPHEKMKLDLNVFFHQD